MKIVNVFGEKYIRLQSDCEELKFEMGQGVAEGAAGFNRTVRN